MNKKLVLSVLSTAVVASMASAAMAKPEPGFYIGGDTPRYYGNLAFLNDFDASLNTLLDNWGSVIYVDDQMRTATLEAALRADDLNSVLKPATKADFENKEYQIVGDPDGKTWDPVTDPDLNDPVTPGELKVESVSAINANTIEVLFNNEVDATKVITSNFTVLNKNSAPAGSVTKALLSADKKKVTLTVSQALTAADQPYTLFINKNDIVLEQNQFTIEVSATAPTVSEVTVDSKNKITVDFDKDIDDAALAGGLAAAVTITNLTDATKVHAVTTASINADKNLEVDFSGDLIAGHNYKVTVAKDAVVDSFGTKNEAIEKSFSVVNNEVVPASSSVTFVKSKNGEIDAILTFNIPVYAVDANVNIKIQDRAGFVTSGTKSLSVLDSKASEATQTGRVEGLKLANNQLLIQNVDSVSTAAPAVTLTAGKEYGLVLDANEVTDTTLAGLENEATTSIATYNIDIVAPTITAKELVSANEIKLTLSEAVTYDSTKKVEVSGFDADGLGTDVEATVTLSADGKTAILKPKTNGQLFATDASATNDLTIEAGAFVDVATNKSIAVADTLLGATDKAAPVVVSTTLNAGEVTVTFTEDVVASDNAATKNILVDGAVYKFDATTGKKWTVSGNVVVIYGGADKSQVVIAAGTVKDAATPANLNAQATVTVKDVTPTAPANNAPTVANAIADVTQAATAGNITINLEDAGSEVFADTDGDPLTYTVTITSDVDGILTSVTEAGGVITIVPEGTNTGTATITVEATDGTDTVTDTFDVTLN